MNFIRFPPAETPLVTSGDSLEIFPGESHLHALGAVLSALRAGDTCVLLTGDEGVGKSVVLNAVAARLVAANSATVLKLRQALPPAALQQLLAKSLGLDDGDAMTPGQLDGRLATTATQGRGVVMLVDGAEDMPVAALQYLRLAAELFGLHARRLQLVIAGRPALLEHIGHKALAGRGLASEPVVINPLDAAEMGRYVDYRLAHAGCAPGFALGRGALRAIVAHARGVPRRADMVLRYAMPRGPDGRCQPITRATLASIGVGKLPVARPLPWRGVAGLGLGIMVVGIAGMVAWDWRGEPRRAPAVVAAAATVAAPVPPAPPADPSSAADAQIARLLRTADAQIAANHISAPADDNLLSSFQQLDALVPAASDAGRRAVETMDARFAAEAKLADQAGRTDEAERFRRFAAGKPSAQADPPPKVASVKAAPTGGAPVHVTLLYKRGDAAAGQRANRLAAALQTDGMRLNAFPAKRRGSTLVVRYYGNADRDGALLIAKRLSALTGENGTIELTRRDPTPPPGWVEALLP